MPSKIPPPYWQIRRVCLGGEALGLPPVSPVVATTEMTVRLSWRQVVSYLNAAGYYAKRPPNKNAPGRKKGFSLREESDRSVRLTYAALSGSVTDEERATMLAAYAVVLTKAGILYEADATFITIRGWHEPERSARSQSQAPASC